MPGTSEQLNDPWRWSLSLALAFLALMVIRLDIPGAPMFDETHYVPAARNWLDGGFWSNREHPVLAKTLLAAQIAMLGDHAFAWRILPVLFGAFTLFALMRAIWFASGSFFATIAYGILLASGFLLFVNSRIAMLDVYMLGFFSLALWQLAAAVREPETGRRRLAIAGIAMGLALGCKWNIVLLLPLPGLGFFFFRLSAGRKHLLTSKRGVPIPGVSLVEAFLLLGLLPLATYWLTFLPAVTDPIDPLKPLNIIGQHQEMLALQNSVKEPHPYQSTISQWLFNIRAIWYLYEQVDGAWRGIVMLGNPFTMLLGLPALIWCAWVGLFRHRWDALAVTTLYMVSLGMWALTDKPILFYYHYLTPSCFLLAALALALDHIRLRWNIWIPVTILAASVVLFFYFYPILSAAPLAGEMAFLQWMWLDSWR